MCTLKAVAFNTSVMVQISTESAELEELREMKSDVERREKAQAAVLERQAKRLEELETLYKVSMVLSAQQQQVQVPDLHADISAIA